MDLKQLINESVSKAVEEKLPEIIQTNVEKLISNAMSDLLSPYGDIAKDIKEKISKEINVNTMSFSLQEYNAIIANQISNYLKIEDKAEDIKELIKSINGDIDYSEIHFSDFIEEVINEFKSDSIDDEGEITVHMDQNHEFGWTTIYLDEYKGIEKDRCNIQITITHKNDDFSKGKILLFRTKMFDSNAVNLSGFTRIHGIERFIFKLYSARVMMTGLDHEPDLSWSNYEY